MRKVEQPILLWNRVVAALFVALVVGSCSSTPKGPPHSQHDICSIFAQRPDWRKAMLRSEARWGAPVPVQMAIMWRESSFRGEARPPKTYFAGFIPTGRQSSAYGYSQAIDGTWDWYRRESGNRGGRRDRFDDAADFVGWYMAKTVNSNGLAMTDAFNHYLAYHEGHTGYRRGSWRQKLWLVNAASQVAEQASRYGSQMRSC